jgi:molybdate transport system permease protein
MIDWSAVLVTVRMAAAVTAILAVAAPPLAYWLATTRCRARPAVEAVVALPLVLPPTVLGFFVLAASAGTPLPFSFAGIVAGATLVNLPFAVRPMALAFAAVDRRHLEAAWCLGHSRISTYFRVAVPLAGPGLAAGLILTFAHAVGEFGVVLMVGGNIPGVTRTLSITLYDEVQALDYAAAGRTSALLVAFALAALALTHALLQRSAPAGQK